MMNYKQIYAKKKACEKRITDTFGDIPNTSGIYVFTRTDEHGIWYAYVGQAKNLLSRIAEHLIGYQHIDLSIKKHGLYSKEKNVWGYSLKVFLENEGDLDNKEKEYISLYASLGYQLRNKTIGGQNKGKDGLDDNKPSKGYHDGLEQGRKNAINEIKVLFEKYLDFSIKGEPNKIKERKLNEFKEMLDL
jgi:hypothetical protein